MSAEQVVALHILLTCSDIFFSCYNYKVLFHYLLLYLVCVTILGRGNAQAQNLKAMFATSRYSAFENLYLSVVKNLGLTSSANDRTSSTIGARYFSSMLVIFSISLFQQLTFLRFFVDSMRLAAAISDGLYFKSEASSREIS